MAEKVGKDYWERVWQPAELPRQVQPQQDTLRNHSYHEFHRLFSRLVPAPPRARLIEVRCAQTIWLSHFGGPGGMRGGRNGHTPRRVDEGAPELGPGRLA